MFSKVAFKEFLNNLPEKFVFILVYVINTMSE